MTGMVLGNSTLKYLTPSVNAPLVYLNYLPSYTFFFKKIDTCLPLLHTNLLGYLPTTNYMLTNLIFTTYLSINYLPI
jgi:uncharacterized membrane protein YeiB